MYRQRLLRNFMTSELIRYQKLYRKMESQLKKLPPGTLCMKRGQLCSQMRINGKQYITQIVNDNGLVNELKTRRYIKKCLPVLKKKIALCRAFLEQDIIYDPTEFECQLPCQYNNPENLDIFLDEKINLSKWLLSGHKNTQRFTEVHYTINQVKCRSKSEALIGTCLEHRGLLYIYEPKVKLKHKTVYPDFAIYLPKSKRIIYFEHFGMIDDPKYSTRNFPKLAEYAESGIYVGINLFYTTETKAKPLTTKDINKIIDSIIELDEELFNDRPTFA